MSTNAFGLDEDYFRNKFQNLIVDLERYTPIELSRYLTKLALAADPETAIITAQTYEIEQSTPKP